MKISEPTNAKKFEPFSVTLTFESIEEVQALWMHINPSSAVIYSNNGNKFSFKSELELEDFKPAKLWLYLNKKLNSL